MVVANLSGGRDSTCMVVKWLEMGNKLDYILFCDTKYEFKEMYEYIDKIESYLLKHFNQALTRIKSSEGIEEWAFMKPITRGREEGRFRGLPKVVGRDYCTRETKIRPSRDFVVSKSPNKFKNSVLIGYTFNEVENGRVSNLDYAISRYPLHEWRFNEPEVESFLKKRGIANPLYRYFDRTGCFLCPKQNLKSLYNLYLHYPKEWEFMKAWEARAKALDCVTQTFKIDISLESLESRFKDKANEQKLFKDFEKEYKHEHTCFCR